jgi:hypothetical protein
VAVAGDDGTGFRSKSALEDSVVGFVLAHDVHRLGWWTRTVKLPTACFASRTRGADQPNLRANTPATSSRIAGEI